MKAFILQLRTQYIYRIAAGYMVSSWLILQIASLLCSALGLPNWTLKAILALLLVGFGAALIIGSWIDLRAARLAAAGPRQWSRKVHLVFWPAGAMLIVGGTTLVVSAFLDAYPDIQTAEFRGSNFGAAGGIRDAHPGNRAYGWNQRFGW